MISASLRHLVDRIFSFTEFEPRCSVPFRLHVHLREARSNDSGRPLLFMAAVDRSACFC